MLVREATIEDIPQLHAIRVAVKENRLPMPSMIRPEDYVKFLTARGKGWVYEMENAIVGFAVIDMIEKNIWALFVHPDHERKGVGAQLQQTMLDWYFDSNNEPVWLGTGAGTRAENFYRQWGWIEVGRRKNGEIKFEMRKNLWRAHLRK